MPAITWVNKVSAKQRIKPTTTTNAKQQLLSKEIFSPIITKFKRERIIPLYKMKLDQLDFLISHL